MIFIFKTSFRKWFGNVNASWLFWLHLFHSIYFRLKQTQDRTLFSHWRAMLKIRPFYLEFPTIDHRCRKFNFVACQPCSTDRLLHTGSHIHYYVIHLWATFSDQRICKDFSSWRGGYLTSIIKYQVCIWYLYFCVSILHYELKRGKKL